MGDMLHAKDLSTKDLLLVICRHLNLLDGSGHLRPRYQRVLEGEPEGTPYTHSEYLAKEGAYQAADELAMNPAVEAELDALKMEFERAQAMEAKGLPPPGDEGTSTLRPKLLEMGFDPDAAEEGEEEPEAAAPRRGGRPRKSE